MPRDPLAVRHIAEDLADGSISFDEAVDAIVALNLKPTQRMAQADDHLDWNGTWAEIQILGGALDGKTRYDLQVAAMTKAGYGAPETP